VRAELPFQVSDTGGEDPANIKIPYMKDYKRQEMYLMHMQNPEENTIETLSKLYGTSLERTTAIIFLMRKRHEFIAADVEKIKAFFPSGDAAPSSSEVQYVTPGLDVPAPLMKLYNTHLADGSTPIADLLSVHNAACAEKSEPGLTGVSEEQLKDLFAIIKKHGFRRAAQEQQNQMMQEKLDRAQEAGVDVNTFRETARAYRSGKASNASAPMSKHVTRSFQDLYYPDLLRDGTAKAAEKRLLLRIEKETRAQLEHDVDHYERMYSDQAPLPPVLQQHEAPLIPPSSADAPLSRWKLAFQDLSTNASGSESPGQLRIPGRTIVRTRTGSLRFATPLEESNRSWRVRPTGVDVQLAALLPHFNQRLVAPYTNVDGDDQLVADMKQRRKSQRAALPAKASN